MKQQYPQYGFTEQDVEDSLVRYVRLDNPASYPFDSFHSHSYNELLYFENGGGIHNINFVEHAIVDNAIHLLNAGDIHWIERSISSDGFAIVYKDSFLYKLQAVNPTVDYLTYFDKSRVINLSVSETENLQLLIQEIKNNSENKLYLINLIGAFFTKLSLAGNHPKDVKHDFSDTVVKQFFELLQKHFKTQFYLHQYAEKLHLSEVTLQRKIKKATGKTVKAIQQELLLKEAKRLLIQTDAPLKEIAETLGFKELAHFSNWFKKQANKQPGHYRM